MPSIYSLIVIHQTGSVHTQATIFLSTAIISLSLHIVITLMSTVPVQKWKSNITVPWMQMSWLFGVIRSAWNNTDNLVLCLPYSKQSAAYQSWGIIWNTKYMLTFLSNISACKLPHFFKASENNCTNVVWESTGKMSAFRCLVEDDFKIRGLHAKQAHLQSLSNGYIDGSVQNHSISIANALEILQSCTKPSIW